MSRAAILIGVGEVHGQSSSETVEYNLARICYTWNSCQQIQGKFAINPFFATPHSDDGLLRSGLLL